MLNRTIINRQKLLEKSFQMTRDKQLAKSLFDYTKLTDPEPELLKAIMAEDLERLEKGKSYPVGTIRTWSGQRHVKTQRGWKKMKGKGDGTKGTSDEETAASNKEAITKNINRNKAKFTDEKGNVDQDGLANAVFKAMEPNSKQTSTPKKYKEAVRDVIGVKAGSDQAQRAIDKKRAMADGAKKVEPKKDSNSNIKFDDKNKFSVEVLAAAKAGIAQAKADGDKNADNRLDTYQAYYTKLEAAIKTKDVTYIQSALLSNDNKVSRALAANLMGVKLSSKQGERKKQINDHFGAEDKKPDDKKDSGTVNKPVTKIANLPSKQIDALRSTTADGSSMYTKALVGAHIDQDNIVSIDGKRLTRIKHNDKSIKEGVTVKVPDKKSTKGLDVSSLVEFDSDTGKKFPNYKLYIPKSYDNTVQINVKQFKQAITKLKKLTDSASSQIRFNISDGKLKAQAVDDLQRPKPETEIEIPIKGFKGDNMEFGLHAVLTKDLLKYAQGDTLRMNFNTPLSPFSFDYEPSVKNPNDANFQQINMPLKI